MKNAIEYGVKSIFLLIILLAALGATNGFSEGLTIDQNPLFLVNATDPRVMLVMSRDHQLYIKAYTDYSDLDEDGTLDTTYNDKVNYSGYFDSEKCYTYASSRFEPSRKVPQEDSHACGGSGEWSGNFLNWATMTRMDLVRKVLFGGYRSTDTSTETVLERVLLPYDVHSFAKIFTTSTTSDMQKFTPYSQTSISICNLTQGSGVSNSVNTSTYPPLIRVASGQWPRWAASEVTQCQWGSGTQPANSKNLVSSSTDAGLIVRVKVCVSGSEEANCVTYPNGNKKPTGLLQKYGKPSAVSVRFGLMTGSYQKNKSGGVLRRNLSRICDNPTATASLNEFDKDTGQFLNQGATDAGIINTLNRFRISSYNYGTKAYGNSCGSPGILSFTDGQCVDWGNPLSEIYLETLRYLAGKTSATADFNANDSTFIPSLPQVTWSDPMPVGEWCAYNAAIVISTGLNSFDTDQLNNDLGIDAAGKTNEVGTQEGISGSYLIGDNGTTSNNQCTAKSLSGLANAKGVCPEVPSLQGGYHIAGLAYNAHINDLRSDRQGKQLIDTFTIALAESLPRFEIPVGDATITLLPACEANSTGTATATSTGWRACSMTDLTVEQLNYVGSGDDRKLVSGSFMVNWEDSTWGNDYDMDGIERLSFCVGSACSNLTVKCPTQSIPDQAITWPSVADNQLAVTSCVIQTTAGHALRFGYTVTGSTNDSVKLPILRPGSKNFDVGSILPSGVDPPNTTLFSAGSSTGKLLENPLFYAAKYGAFKDENDNKKPDLESEWNADNDSKKIPDGFNQVKSPAKLEKALDDILANVIKVAKETGSSTAVTTNSTRLETSSLVYQAQFNSGSWTGRMFAYSLFFDDPNNQEGSIGNLVWDVTYKFPDPDDRNIFSYNPDLLTTKGIEFTWDDLSDSQKALLDKECFDDATNCTESLILNYLRGDDSEETPDGPYRSRTETVVNKSGEKVDEHLMLSDIINSDPWFVGIDNFGYNILPDPEGSEYLTYRSSDSYVNRRKVIYVGANDGMLHGFDATDSDDGGKEILAYVPNTVITSQTIQTNQSDLRSLTRPNYTHKYFVDGSPRAGDVYFGGAWHTVLAGTLGAGGKGIFALDVTNPDAFSTSDVLWEINTVSSPNSSDLSDTSLQAGFTNNLGYTFSQPSVIRMANGKWAIVIGNGYNSISQKAVLYIIDAETGHLIKSIDTMAGSATQPNGLSTPIVVDVNDDRIIDTIYAGDLLGNLWKFNVSNSSPSNWDVAFKSGITPLPLFVAKDANNVPQPITAKPQAGRNPDGGVLVYFGTGRYFVQGDNNFDAKLVNVSPPPTVQTFYGIWDNNAQVTRSNLVAQSIITEQTVDNYKIRITTNNEVDYTSSAKGWYIDLVKPSATIGGVATAQGERVVAFAVLRPGNRIVFTTLIPSSSSCEFGGTSWLMEIEATTGKRLATTFDLNGDWKVDSQDMQQITLPTGGPSGGPLTITVAASGKQSLVGIVKTPGIVTSPGGSIEYKYTSGTKKCNPKAETCPETVKGSLEVTAEDYGADIGRQSWRQLR